MRYCGVACGQFPFFLRAQGVDRALPGEGPVTGAARQHDPQHFPNVRTGPAPFYTSDPHGCAQQTCRRSRAGLAGSGSACRCLRDTAGAPDAGSGPGLDDIAQDGGHRMLTAHPLARQAARASPADAVPPVTLTMIVPSERVLDTLTAARASRRGPRRLAASSPCLRGATVSRPGGGRRPDPRSTDRARVTAHRALRDPWPSDPGSPAVRSGRADAARATARHPVLRARTPTVLHGSAAGAAAPRSPLRPGAAAREPRPARP